jgi:Spy/CpxP family protein refolding chaperone
MFGFLIGTACLVGLAATLRAGCHGRGRHFGHFRRHGGRFFLNALLDRLDTTPGQEKTIREAVDQFSEDARSARRAMRATRGAVARSIEQSTFDAGALDAVFREHDGVIDGLRKSAVSAFARIHETLDDRQRKTLADLVESGPFGRGFGMHQCAS